MGAWKLVVEGDSGREEAAASASVFIDMLRAEGHTVRQATFYGDVGREGKDVTAGSMPAAFVPVVESAPEPEPEPEPTP